jgi:hypothetical protein
VLGQAPLGSTTRDDHLRHHSFRNTLGVDIAMEALREYLKKHQIYPSATGIFETAPQEARCAYLEALV